MKRPRVHVGDGIAGRQWETAEPRDMTKPDGRRSRNSDPRFKEHAADLPAPTISSGRWTRIKYVDGKRLVYIDGVLQS